MKSFRIAVEVFVGLVTLAHEAHGFRSSAVGTQFLSQRDWNTRCCLSKRGVVSQERSKLLRDALFRSRKVCGTRQGASLASLCSCDGGLADIDDALSIRTAVDDNPTSLTAEDSAAAPVQSAEKTNYHDSWIDRTLQKFITLKIREALAQADGIAVEDQQRAGAGTASRTPVYDEFIDVAIELSRRPGWQTQLLTLGLLRGVFPSWFPGAFRAFLALFPMWFDARHAAVSTVLTTRWLVGPSEVCDVDAAVLDASTRRGWGNEPTGWVPGYALGGRWRKEAGAGQGVKIAKCRVLEMTGCASVCANVCKGPTQAFFTEDVGLPLTMVPDFETMSCEFIFGATPPEYHEDPAFSQSCLAACKAGGQRPEDAERTLGARRQAAAAAAEAAAAAAAAAAGAAAGAGIGDGSPPCFGLQSGCESAGEYEP